MERHVKTVGEQAPAQRKGHTYVNFLFLKAEISFRTLQSNEKLVAKQQFLDAFDRYHERTALAAYSLVGLRADCDLLLWRVDPCLETFQEMSSRLLTTGIGKYLRPVYSYLGATHPPATIRNLGLETGQAPPVPGKFPYLFTHPFVRNRTWYALPVAERRRILEEHRRVRDRYPGLRLQIFYSLGLDDQDLLLAFESENPGEFLELAAELRESVWGAYTLRDTPAFTCIVRDPREILDSLG